MRHLEEQLFRKHNSSNRMPVLLQSLIFSGLSLDWPKHEEHLRDE